MARKLFRPQFLDVANLLIAGDNVTIEPNTRISSAGISAESIVDGNITVTNAFIANNFVVTGVGIPTVYSKSNIHLNTAGNVVISYSPLRLRSYTNGDLANISNSNAGDWIFNSTTKTMQVYNGSSWANVNLG